MHVDTTTCILNESVALYTIFVPATGRKAIKPSVICMNNTKKKKKIKSKQKGTKKKQKQKRKQQQKNKPKRKHYVLK